MQKLIYVKGIRKEVHECSLIDMQQMAVKARQIVLCKSGTVIIFLDRCAVYVDGMTQEVLDSFSFFVCRPYNMDADKENQDVWQAKSGSLVFDNCASYLGG
jgi:hypothetical protein